MPRRHNIELLKSGMDREDPGKVCSRIRSVVRIVFSVSLAALAILAGCSRDSGSRIHVELHDIPEAKPAAQTVIKTDLSCPVGDLPDVDFQTGRSPNHSVKLSWNLSTSSYGPNGKNIFYCLYRTDGRAVEKNTSSKYPCAGCRRVTKTPVPGATTDPDQYVKDGAQYCYVAVAIDIRSGKLSDFSNQAGAAIPPSTDRPSCIQQTNAKQANAKKRRDHP